jgi:hypothetical protein
MTIAATAGYRPASGPWRINILDLSLRWETTYVPRWQRRLSMPVAAPPTPSRRALAGKVSTRGQTVGTSRASVSFWYRTDGAALLPMRLAPVTLGLAADGRTYPVTLLEYVPRPVRAGCFCRVGPSREAGLEVRCPDGPWSHIVRPNPEVAILEGDISG